VSLDLRMIAPGSISTPVWNSSRADVSVVVVPWHGTARQAEPSAFCSLSATTGTPSMRIIVFSPSFATALAFVLPFVRKTEKYSSWLQWCGAFAPTAMPERRYDLLERSRLRIVLPKRSGSLQIGQRIEWTRSHKF
jgi:hypothetical protein